MKCGSGGGGSTEGMGEKSRDRGGKFTPGGPTSGFGDKGTLAQPGRRRIERVNDGRANFGWVNRGSRKEGGDPLWMLGVGGKNHPASDKRG